MADAPKQTPMKPPADRKASIGSYESGNAAQPRPRTMRSQSLTTSTLPPNVFLPPELQRQYNKRRESLDRLQLNKVSPWMHLYDFSECEPEVSDSPSATSSS